MATFPSAAVLGLRSFVMQSTVVIGDIQSVNISVDFVAASQITLRRRRQPPRLGPGPSNTAGRRFNID